MPVWNPATQIPIRSIDDLHTIEATPFENITAARSGYEILQIQAAERAEEPALVFLPTAAVDGPAAVLTYAQLFGRVTQAANFFHEASAGEPPVVAIMLPLLPQAHIALWGGTAAGKAMPLNFLLRVEELAQLLEDARATVLVAMGPNPVIDIWSKAMALKERVSTLKTVVRVSGQDDADPKGVVAFDAAVHDRPADRLVSGRKFDFDDIVAYFHTGGTTGSPKLAQHTNRNHVAMAFGVGRSWGFEAGERVLNGLPVFHVGGALDAGLAVLANGGTMLLPTPAGLRNPEVVGNLWKLAEKHRLNVVGGVPTSITAMLDVPVGDADVSHVRMAITGGSAMPPGPAVKFEERFGVPLRQVYGMTETSGNGVTAPRASEGIPAACAGIRTAYTQVKTVRIDPETRATTDCGPDDVGVIVMRGPTVTPGYTDAARNAALFVDGDWLVSGDLGRVTAEGYVWVTGRAKDVIIRSGHNIDPALIEDEATRHPAVATAAAVGCPDEYAGELPALFVTLVPGAEATVDDLRGWLHEHIAEPPAMPKIIEVIETMPLTAIGKVFRPALRDRLIERIYADRLKDLPGPPKVTAATGAQGADVTVSVPAAALSEALTRTINERLARFTLSQPVVVSQ